MKGLRSRILLLGGCLLVTTAGAYGVLCGDGGSVNCGTTCTRAGDGSCTCEGQCTDDELRAIIRVQ